MNLQSKYIPIATAAKKLLRTPNDLIHLGAIGKLPIYLIAFGNEFKVYTRTHELTDGPTPPKIVYGIWKKQEGMASVDVPIRLRMPTLSALASSKESVIFESRFVGEGPNEDDVEYEYRLAQDLVSAKGISLNVTLMVVYVDDLERCKLEEAGELMLDKPESPKELRNLKKLVAALSLLLAEDKKNLKMGDKLNKAAVAERVIRFLQEKSTVEGLSDTSISNHISAGLTELDLKN